MSKTKSKGIVFGSAKDTNLYRVDANQLKTDDKLDKAIQNTADYLYKIDGECSTELQQAIAILRQLINEEYVGKDKTVSSQLIYDIINPAITKEIKQAKKEQARLLDALGLMYSQYCSDKFGHDFMSAGEAAIDILEDYGIHSEDWEWTDKSYDKLEQVVNELNKD